MFFLPKSLVMPLVLCYLALLTSKLLNTNWDQLNQVPLPLSEDFTSPDAQRWATQQTLPYSQFLTGQAPLLWSHQRKAGLRTSSSSLLYLATVLLTGCIETNPGPEFPCISCGEEVTFEQRAVCCDSCEQWMHKSCMGMDSVVYNFLAGSDCMWICPSSICDVPNFSSTLFRPPLVDSTTANSYAVLADSLRSNSSTRDDQNRRTPKANSSSISKSTSSSASNRTTSSSSSDSSLGSPIAASSPSHPQQLKKKPEEKVKLAIMNCQSICNKAAELEAFIDSTQPDIIIGTESWLTPDIMSQEIFPSDYITFRRDRAETFGDMKGGGVFILVSNKLVCSAIQVEDANCELTFIQVDLVGSPKLVIGAFYRPPFTDNEYLDNLCKAVDSVRQKHPTAHFILGGDFNVGDVDWPTSSVPKGSQSAGICNQVVELAEDHSLTQVVTMPTRADRLLDILLTDRPALVSRQTLAPPLSAKADHSIVIVDIDAKAYVPKQKPRTSLQYHKADWENFKEDVNKYSTQFLETPFEDTQAMWNNIEEKLMTLSKKHIPTKQVKGKKLKPWITSKVKKTLRRRDRAHRNWRCTGDTKRWNRYQELRKTAQKTLRQAYWDYTEDVLNLDTDPNSLEAPTGKSKKLWSFVKSKRKDPCSVAPLKSKDGVQVSDAVGKAQILNEQYTSVFNPLDCQAPDRDPTDHPVLPPIIVTVEGVQKMLQNLNANKAAGPDQISPRLLKELAPELAPILTRLFQATIDSGTIPTQWKTANVSPVFKKGDRSKPANYRPVSLTAVCCKLNEHIIAKAIMNHLEAHGILSDMQHGFRRARSCETQLVTFIQELVDSVAHGGQVDVVIMDFAKAFDKVPYQRLLGKLHHYGIQGSTLDWIAAFLSDRTQKVIVDGEASESAPVTSGVPQGSVLGPILFLCYINDLPEQVSSRCRLFADDSILYREIKTPQDSSTLQEDLDALAAWEEKWGMAFHPDKCTVLRITRKKEPIATPYNLRGHQLEIVDHATYLGVEIADDLSWKKHVTKVKNKATKTLGFVRRNVTTSSIKAKTLAYQSLVRPQLEYSATVWHPHTEDLTKTLEMVQRRAARYVLNQYARTASVTAMLRRLDWELLQHRRMKLRLTLMYKIINQLVAISADPHFKPVTRRTRSHHSLKFQQISTTKAYHQASFFISTIPLWNLAPATLVEAPSLEVFRQELTKFRFP